MTDVRIAAVRDYEDSDLLRRTVATAVAAAPGIAALFDRSDLRPLVVVKPNWIQQSHELTPDVWEPVITHPQVLLAVIDTLAELMAGRGTICICDAPHTHADFDAILSRGGLQQAIRERREAWPELQLEVLDLRREVWAVAEGVVVDRRPNPEDPRGYVRLDLARESLFYRHSGEGRYYGADYDSRVVNRHHQGEVHEYLLAGSPIAADLFVNLPKLKTHKKTGITCCLKNLVGINGDKNWLPHHTEGCPSDGGDEFPDDRLAHSLERRIKRAGRKLALAVPGVGTWAYRKARNVGMQVLGDSQTVIRSGNWHGNDTCWRMALDLNRALLYGNRDGSWRQAGSAKHYLAIVDGVLGGEGNGPIAPDPVASKVVISGTNPATVDAVCSKLMGYDPRTLPIVASAFDAHARPIADREMSAIRVDDRRAGAVVSLEDVEPAVPRGFKPHFGWTPLEKGA